MPQPGQRSRPLRDTWGPVRLREAGPSPEPPAGHTLAAGASSGLAATRRQAGEGIFCSSDLTPHQMPPNVCAAGSCPCPARGHLRSCSKFPDLQQQGGTSPELPKVSTWLCTAKRGLRGESSLLEPLKQQGSCSRLRPPEAPAPHISCAPGIIWGRVPRANHLLHLPPSCSSPWHSWHKIDPRGDRSARDGAEAPVNLLCEKNKERCFQGV